MKQISYYPLTWSETDGNYVCEPGHCPISSNFEKDVLYWVSVGFDAEYVAIDDHGNVIKFRSPRHLIEPMESIMRELELEGMPFGEILKALQV